MKELVSLKEGELLTTSKIICDVFGKTHRSVVKSIVDMECSMEFRARNFMSSSYLSTQNKKIRCVTLTRDGFSFLCMGFTGKKAAVWKEKYIEAFNQMEKGLLNIDARMTKISIEAKTISEAGKKWSSLGQEINKQKKINTKQAQDLVNDVQMKLAI